MAGLWFLLLSDRLLGPIYKVLMEEARWGAACPGIFTPVLTLRVKCSLFRSFTNNTAIQPDTSDTSDTSDTNDTSVASVTSVTSATNLMGNILAYRLNSFPGICECTWKEVPRASPSRYNITTDSHHSGVPTPESQADQSG